MAENANNVQIQKSIQVQNIDIGSMVKKTQHICTMWKTCQDIEVSSKICFAYMQGKHIHR